MTQFNDFDITFPSIGPDAIVFQAGGRLYLLDFATEKATEVPVHVVTDETTLRPRTAKVEPLINAASASPTGQARRVRGARRRRSRCRPSTAPVINVTRSSGRDGAVSALVARRQDDRVLERSQRRVRADACGRRTAAGAERKVTSLGAGFRYTPYWSPDSKKVAFIDQAMRIHVTDDRHRQDRRRRPEPRLDRARRPRAVPFAVVARLALADLRAPDGGRQQRHLPLRHEGGQADAGDDRRT